ncbi:hypothetical protein Tco_0793107 [Tanacetum coccineum]
MAETMEEYMSKIRDDYGSGVTKPKIDDKFHFELKGQFLKELRDNTFSGSNHKDANEHIEIVLEIMLLSETKEPDQNFGDSNRVNEQGTTRKRIWKFPSSTEINPEDHVKSISTIIEADTSPICHIGSSQYAVSAQQNRKLFFKSRQATILFPSRLNDYRCDEKGSYGPQYLDAYSCGATRLNDSLP